MSAAELRYDIRTIVFALLPTGLSGSFAIDPGLASLLTLACTFCRSTDSVNDCEQANHYSITAGQFSNFSLFTFVGPELDPGMGAFHKARDSGRGTRITGGGPGRPPFWRTLISPTERWGRTRCP